MGCLRVCIFLLRKFLFISHMKNSMKIRQNYQSLLSKSIGTWISRLMKNGNEKISSDCPCNLNIVILLGYSSALAEFVNPCTM